MITRDRVLPLIIIMVHVVCVPVNSAYCQTATFKTVTVSARGELVRAVENAGPGTSILIAPGTYRGGLRFAGVQGAEGEPIVLKALDVRSETRASVLHEIQRSSKALRTTSNNSRELAA